MSRLKTCRTHHGGTREYLCTCTSDSWSEPKMRREWDYTLSELCGGSTDPDAGALANRIEMTVRRYERALEAIVEMSGDQPARTAWNMVHLARAALAPTPPLETLLAKAVDDQ